MFTAMIKGLYPYFFPLVFYGIFLRIYEKKWTRGETILSMLFLGYFLLIQFQFFLGEGSFSRRYLLPGVPLIFGWAGYALHHLSSQKGFSWIAVICLLFLLQDALRPSLEHYWKKNKKEELFVIRELSPVLRRDWHTQPAFYAPEIWWDAYHSPKRPLVQCEKYPLLGYVSGGCGISQDDPLLPLPDYRIFVNCPVSSPYIEIHRSIYLEKTYCIGKRME